MLPKDLENIIYKQVTSMNVHKINQEILKINRTENKADDIYCHNMNGNEHFWDNNHNVKVLRYRNLKIKAIYLDYITYRDFRFQLTYICNDCGEFLKQSEKKDFQYFCNCAYYYY